MLIIIIPAATPTILEVLGVGIPYINDTMTAKEVQARRA